MMTARQAAYDGLMKVEEQRAYSNLTLDKLLNNSGMNGRERSLAARLFYGVLENKLLLDYNIAVRADRPVGQIDTGVLVILRLGLYQIHFCDGIPTSAAVNETVALCRHNHFDNATGFVNGILRASAKQQELLLPNPKKGKNKYYSVRFSCPEPIIRLWRESYGDENTLGLLSSLSERPPLCVRVNTLKTTADELIEELKKSGVRAEKSAYMKECLLLKDTGAIETLEQYHQGLFHVQDAASQICCSILSPKNGDRVLDICSAPGGKTFTCAELMKNQGEILSCDLYESRLKLVRSGAERLGLSIIRTVCADASTLQTDFQADRVLCDVPCSGLGIIRRKPELRYKEDLGLTALPEIQYKILQNAAGYVKKGGVLVYSTCTLNPAENHENAARFLEEHKEFQACEIILPQGMERGIQEAENELTLMPHIHSTDGFFISLFRRK